jgi:hypothetical protein
MKTAEHGLQLFRDPVSHEERVGAIVRRPSDSHRPIQTQ